MQCLILLFVLATHADGHLSYYQLVEPDQHHLEVGDCEAKAAFRERLAEREGRQVTSTWAMVPDGQWIAWTFTWVREDGAPATAGRWFLEADKAVEGAAKAGEPPGRYCLGARRWLRDSFYRRHGDPGAYRHQRAVTACWHASQGLWVATDPDMSVAEYREIRAAAAELPEAEP